MRLTGRRLAPRSLLGRSLLLILVPLLLVQAVALRIFYGTHLDLVSRRFSASVAGEIEECVELLRRFPRPEDRRWIIRSAQEQFSLGLRLLPNAALPRRKQVYVPGPADDELAQALRQQVRRPFTMDWRADPQSIVLFIDTGGGDLLRVEAPRKRVYAGTMVLFVVWVGGASLALFVIAALFMRNQVRAIRRLALAMEAFGIGREPGMVRPEGAAEVRRAAAAFNRMQERVGRFLAQRTEMLAGVSHDLRTPLTRLRLALAMLPASSGPDVRAMTDDVAEMDRMIGGYLAFARGEGAEQARPAPLRALLAEVAAACRRGGGEIALGEGAEITTPLRLDAMRRAITNLVQNALRHAAHVRLDAGQEERGVAILIDDDGPGIPPERREGVFRPFESAAGGTGLGLTIARDTARAHGGDIVLETSPMGGLRARIRLPAREMET